MEWDQCCVDAKFNSIEFSDKRWTVFGVMGVYYIVCRMYD